MRRVSGIELFLFVCLYLKCVRWIILTAAFIWHKSKCVILFVPFVLCLFIPSHTLNNAVCESEPYVGQKLARKYVFPAPTKQSRMLPACSGCTCLSAHQENRLIRLISQINTEVTCAAETPPRPNRWDGNTTNLWVLSSVTKSQSQHRAQRTAVLTRRS